MIDLQGWMYWQATDKSSILGKPLWKRRWVVLTPDAIFVYKHEKVVPHPEHREMNVSLMSCVQETSCPPHAFYPLSCFQTCSMVDPTKKTPTSISLIPNPEPTNAANTNRASTGSSSSLLIRRARRQSIPSLHAAAQGSAPIAQSVNFRADTEPSPVSLHEWQRSINDRIKTIFPTENYQVAPPAPPPPPVPKVPKVPYGTVNMYVQTPVSTPSNRHTMSTSSSHKSLSHSVTSNLSSALSSMTSPSSRRKSRVISPSEARRIRDLDQQSMTSTDSLTPPTTISLQQGYFDEDSSLNAEKVLEQAMRHHQQRRHQQRFGGPGSLKSKASSVSVKESSGSTASSPAQNYIAPSTRVGQTLPARRIDVTSQPSLSIASFEVLIKELEAEEEERKRNTIILSTKTPPTPPQETSVPAPANPQARPQRRPSALNDAKRRSTGSILFSHPFTPTFPLDKENSSPLSMDRKSMSAGGHKARRISVASFGSEHSDSKRNSAHEVTLNLVEWSSMDRRGSKEYTAMVRSNSVVTSSMFGDLEHAKRLASYNFGRRGSVY